LGAKDIRLITDWPHPESRLPNNEKVLSSICYKNGKPSRWGYKAELGDNSLKWIKVLLEPSPRFAEKVALIKKSNELLQRLNKTADDVVADYLRLLWQYTLKDIRESKGSDYASKFDLQVFLTVPAIWSDEAKNRVLSAGKAAGLPPNTTCISEPEAAALYVLRKRAEENAIKV
jgi:molecular chaperone DnaK (HSP70)